MTTTADVLYYFAHNLLEDCGHRHPDLKSAWECLKNKEFEVDNGYCWTIKAVDRSNKYTESLTEPTLPFSRFLNREEDEELDDLKNDGYIALIPSPS